MLLISITLIFANKRMSLQSYLEIFGSGLRDLKEETTKSRLLGFLFCFPKFKRKPDKVSFKANIKRNKF